MKLFKVTDPEFKAYGKVIEGIDVTELLEALKETPCTDDVVYVPSAVQPRSSTACSEGCPSRRATATETIIC